MEFLLGLSSQDNLQKNTHFRTSWPHPASLAIGKGMNEMNETQSILVLPSRKAVYILGKGQNSLLAFRIALERQPLCFLVHVQRGSAEAGSALVLGVNWFLGLRLLCNFSPDPPLTPQPLSYSLDFSKILVSNSCTILVLQLGSPGHFIRGHQRPPLSLQVPSEGLHSGLELANDCKSHQWAYSS